MISVSGRPASSSGPGVRNRGFQFPTLPASPPSKTAHISKAPYSPIADPASPRAGGLGLFLAWWVVWLGPRLSRASLGFLRPTRTLGVVDHCRKALEADPKPSAIAKLTSIGFHFIAHGGIQRRILGNLQVKATSHSEGIGSAVFTLSGEGTSTWCINEA